MPLGYAALQSLRGRLSRCVYAARLVAAAFRRAGARFRIEVLIANMKWFLVHAVRELRAAGSCYNRRMTLVEVTYELQGPLRPEQLRALGEFSNTYGLRSFRVDEHLNRLSFEYDASRLKETEVAHVLRMAQIPVYRRV